MLYSSEAFREKLRSYLSRPLSSFAQIIPWIPANSFHNADALADVLT